MEICDFMDRTLEPREVLPLAALFLRWPHETALKINTQLHTIKQGTQIRHNLTIYKFNTILYQEQPSDDFNYKGFLLKLEAHYFSGIKDFERLCSNFSNLFVTLEDVKYIEKLSREYCTLPAGHKKLLKSEICSHKNLDIMIPKILYGILSDCADSTLESTFPDNHKLSKNMIWPWLGPIDPILSNDIKRTISDDMEEITLFIKAARELGQNDNDCLARMMKYRYPNTPMPMLVDIIEPDHGGNSTAKRKQGRRLLGKS